MNSHTADPSLYISNNLKNSVSLDTLVDIGYQHKGHSYPLPSKNNNPILYFPLYNLIGSKGVSDEDWDENNPNCKDGYSDPVLLLFKLLLSRLFGQYFWGVAPEIRYAEYGCSLEYHCV